jgi:hypothetical protein
LPANARASVIVNVLLTGLLAWLYGGDLYDVARAKSSDVAAFSVLPSTPVAIVALSLGALGLALTLFGIIGKRDKTWRGYRVMPIITVVVLFVDLLVLSGDKSPFPSSARAMAALDGLGRRANTLSTPTAIPDAKALESQLMELGPAPWVAKGEPVGPWKVKGFERCTGPQLDPAGQGPGTFLYCVDPAAQHGWLTMVGLPYEQHFGAPQIVARGTSPLVFEVQRVPKEEPVPPTVPQAEDEPEPLPFVVDSDAGA